MFMKVQLPPGQLSWESAGLLSGRSRVQTSAGPTRRKCCRCNDICKQLDFLVFSDKDEKVPSHSTFTDLFLWDIKERTPLFEKSRGRRPWWCGQPLRVVGLGRDGTLHGTYESRSCLFSLGRPLSRKAGKKGLFNLKEKKRVRKSVGFGPTTQMVQQRGSHAREARVGQSPIPIDYGQPLFPWLSRD